MQAVVSDPFFAAVRPEPVATAAGPCELPILYTDASLLGLVYRVDPALARPLVGDAPFEPWTMLGRAITVACFFEYRATSIGPYGEIGLAVLVRRAGTEPSRLGALRDLRDAHDAGLLVVNLPVTTETARAAGVELWGYPKYVTGIETEFRPDGVRIVLQNELRLTMTRGRGLVTRGQPFVTLSVSPRGRVLRTIVEVDHKVRWGGGRSVHLEILGDGPTARNARALGLDSSKPTLAFSTDRMRSILPAGEDLGSAR
jgi:hypothetical protein